MVFNTSIFVSYFMTGPVRDNRSKATFMETSRFSTFFWLASYKGTIKRPVFLSFRHSGPTKDREALLPLAGNGRGEGVLPANKCTSAFTLSFFFQVQSGSAYHHTDSDNSFLRLRFFAWCRTGQVSLPNSPTLLFPSLSAAHYKQWKNSPTSADLEPDGSVRYREDVKKLVNVHSTPSVQQLRHDSIP